MSEKFSRAETNAIIFVCAVLFAVTIIMVDESSEQCRLDAVNYMCNKYGGMKNGEVVDVIAGYNSYQVNCEEFKPKTFSEFVLNVTTVY